MSHSLAQFRNGIAYLRRTLNSDLPCQQVEILLVVALQPNITLTALGEELNMPQGTVSRNVKALAAYFDANKKLKGYDVVSTRPDVVDRNRLSCYLTSKGRKVIEELRKVLNS